MGVLIGPFDPIKLMLSILNQLMQKGVISEQETRNILHKSLDPSMPEEKKNEILDKMIRRK